MWNALIVLGTMFGIGSGAPVDIVLLMDTNSLGEAVWNGVRSSVPQIGDYLRSVYPDSKLGIVGISNAAEAGSCIQVSNPLKNVSEWRRSSSKLTFGKYNAAADHDGQLLKALMTIARDDDNMIRWGEDRDRLLIALTDSVPDFIDDEQPRRHNRMDTSWDGRESNSCNELPVPTPQAVKDQLMAKKISLTVLSLKDTLKTKDVPLPSILRKGKCGPACTLFTQKFVRTMDTFAKRFSSRHEEPSTPMIHLRPAPLVTNHLRPSEDHHHTRPHRSDGYGTWWWTMSLGKGVIGHRDHSSMAPHHPVHTIEHGHSSVAPHHPVHTVEHGHSSVAPHHPVRSIDNGDHTRDVRLRDDSDLPLWWLTIGKKIVHSHRPTVVHKHSEDAAADAEKDGPVPRRLYNGGLGNLEGYGTSWYEAHLEKPDAQQVQPAESLE